MLIKKPANIKSSEITDKNTYLNRRRFLLTASASLAAVAAEMSLPALFSREAHGGEKLSGIRKSSFSIDEAQTPFKDITTYNNFYEFGTDKYSPARNAKSLVARPWTVAVEGEVKRAKRH